ncbi:hypothetical protein, partial [Candidatus Nitrosotalea sp. FS]|uniref:hypothetical protein n=1 Tax=Candidatus Nitrosotalea sp. FS TaxID=2341021 RepID=UPI001C4988DB
MKILSMLGIILIIGGLFLAIYGYELCAHFVCTGMYCPSCDTVEPISRLTVYTGIAVMLGGVGFLVYS